MEKGDKVGGVEERVEDEEEVEELGVEKEMGKADKEVGIEGGDDIYCFKQSCSASLLLVFQQALGSVFHNTQN